MLNLLVQILGESHVCLKNLSAKSYPWYRGGKVLLWPARYLGWSYHKGAAIPPVVEIISLTDSQSLGPKVHHVPAWVSGTVRENCLFLSH